MLLKIHQLQVMILGLITVQIKAEEPSLTEVPELYMEDSDKALLNTIWNIAGFPSAQNEQNPEVTRKFFGILKKVAPVVSKKVMQHSKISGYLKKVGPELLKNSVTQIGEIPGFPDKIKPVLPVVASLIPEKFGNLIDLTGTQHTNNNNGQHTRRSYADSPPITINYRALPKPSNWEFVSNRRTLHLENADLENSDRNSNDRETNAKYYITENLKISPQDLTTVNLAMEQMKRMMQFQDVDENIHKKKKSWNFLERKIHQNIT